MLAGMVDKYIKIRGKILKQVREEADHTQESLAAAIGATASTIYKTESEEISQMYRRQKPKLIAALKITREEFNAKLLVPESPLIPDPTAGDISTQSAALAPKNPPEEDPAEKPAGRIDPAAERTASILAWFGKLPADAQDILLSPRPVVGEKSLYVTDAIHAELRGAKYSGKAAQKIDPNEGKKK